MSTTPRQRQVVTAPIRTLVHNLADLVLDDAPPTLALTTGGDDQTPGETPAATRGRPPRRHRDPEFAAFAAAHGLTGAPVLNVHDVVLSQSGARPLDDYEFERSQISFDREAAAAYLALPVFVGERNVRDEWAQNLLSEMVNGAFNWNLVNLVQVDYAGETYKSNGMNTSWARAAWNSVVAPQVNLVVYRVNTAEALRQVYKSCDRGKTRTPSHLMHVELAGQDLNPAIKTRVAILFANGLKFWKLEGRVDYRNCREDEAVALIDEEGVRRAFTAATLFFQGLNISRGVPADRQAVLAAMLATFEVDEPRARVFWGDVLEGSVTKGSAKFALNEYLRGTAFSIKSRDDAGKRIVTSEDVFRSCCHMWNRDRRGGKVYMIKGLAERPKLI